MSRIAVSLMTMDCQVDKDEHFRHPLLFVFNQGSKASKAARDICPVYREGAPTYLMNDDRFDELFHKGPHQSTRELAQQIGSRARALIILLPVTYTQCVRCKTLCVGAKRGEGKVHTSSAPISLPHSTPS
ncbi:hypothetical protein T10_11400 [Trichinella papuae]|uniref:Mos1 transposase HTH domain-containing protein n=1 Tax=Trichinella papuae TaxID=268474 RepID=A0A0V1MQH9_9BILA|nr:hypothetical protein T10_11400 [Trichinella papuae]